jgi:hypothetical protein
MQKLYMLKPFQELERVREKDSGEGVSSNMMYLIHCKDLCKPQCIPPRSRIKGEKIPVSVILATQETKIKRILV